MPSRERAYQLEFDLKYTVLYYRTISSTIFNLVWNTFLLWKNMANWTLFLEDLKRLAEQLVRYLTPRLRGKTMEVFAETRRRIMMPIT